jgi:hypothetical protein
MENLFVSLTNLYGVRAVRRAIRQKLWTEAIVLSGAISASILYHMAETKHGMNSLWLTNYVGTTLNIDRFFAMLATGLFLMKHRKKINKKIIFYGISGLIALMLSECQHAVNLPLRIEKALYLVTHPVWHISAFHVVYLLLSKKVNWQPTKD